MRQLRTIVTTSAFLMIFALGGAAPAAAQTCGDANGNDTITVTDGVQALRAAAGLSSTCEDGCDVDGSGAVTVSDGVNILRKAAGIAINEACDFTAEEANGVTNPSLSIFSGITKVPGAGASSAFAAGSVDCENDGTIETFQGNAQSAASFTNCEIDDDVLDGTIGRVAFSSAVALVFDDFKVTRLKDGASLTFNGQLAITNTQDGRRIAGTLDVISSKRGAFTLEFERILLVGDGSVRDGALIYDLTNTDGGKIAGIRITFTEGDELPVSILLRNKQVKSFILDRGTRKLHLPL